MKRIWLSILSTVLVSGVLGIGLIGHASAAASNWQRSVMIQSRYSTDFASSSFDQSVNNAINDGANYIVLVVSIHQSNIYSTDVAPGGDTPTDGALAAGIAYIHSKGAHAVINIHDDPYDGQWRADINPSDRATWFQNYGNELNHYAALAQSTGTEEFVLGTELSHMTSADYNASNTGYWDTMIQNVRNFYGGKLTYSAQHDGYLSDLQGIGFWSKLDYIGISAYYGLGYDNSVSSIEAQWANWNNSSVGPIASRYGKPVLFTEVGYVTTSNALGDPGSAYGQGGGYDPTTQANAYTALFQYWNNYSYFAGTAMWDWSSDPSAGGAGNTDYTPQGKPAEQVMKQYFTTGGQISGGGTGTVTPPTKATYTFAGQSPATTQTGTATTMNATVKANQAANGVLVDLELYNANGQKVAQQYYENQNLSTTPQTYSLGWTPSTSGTYTLKAGVFTANWSSTLTWNDSVGTIAANAPTQTPPPVTTPPSDGGGTTTPPTSGGGSNNNGGTTTTPPNNGSGGSTTGTGTGTGTGSNNGGTTTTPTPPPAHASIDIWWPGSTQPVSGVHPFKALIDGVDTSTYKMYWQVDNGTLNLMGDNSDSVNHKESAVDLSGWNWQSSGKYTINFVAKDSSGNVIAQKSVVITVTH